MPVIKVSDKKDNIPSIIKINGKTYKVK